jgi:hypothetical protein
MPDGKCWARSDPDRSYRPRLAWPSHVIITRSVHDIGDPSERDRAAVQTTSPLLLAAALIGLIFIWR